MFIFTFKKNSTTNLDITENVGNRICNPRDYIINGKVLSFDEKLPWTGRRNLSPLPVFYVGELANTSLSVCIFGSLGLLHKQRMTMSSSSFIVFTYIAYMITFDKTQTFDDKFGYHENKTEKENKKKRNLLSSLTRYSFNFSNFF